MKPKPQKTPGNKKWTDTYLDEAPPEKILAGLIRAFIDIKSADFRKKIRAHRN